MSSSQQHRPLPPTAAAVTAAFDPSSTSASNSRTTTAGAAASVDHRDVASGGFSTTAPASASPLAGIKVKLRAGLRQFPDFPSPGILFEDIMPLFADPALHADLITALELQVQDSFGASGGKSPIDIVVGLESRGFLFGPTLAARLGAGFVPVRKQGKLPGPCETATYTKEYGSDNFQMQTGAIRSGQRVLIVDDIIATGTAQPCLPSSALLGLRTDVIVFCRW